MHLLITLDRYYPIGGGIQQYVRGLASWMTQNGHQVTILTGTQDGQPERENMPEGLVLRSALMTEAFSAPEKMLDRVVPLTALIREISPDVVYANNHTSIGVIPAAKAAGRRVVYQCHGWGVFCSLKIRLLRPNGELCYNDRSVHRCAQCASMQTPPPALKGRGRTLLKTLWKRLTWPLQMRRYVRPLVSRYDYFQATLEQADALIVGSLLIARLFNAPAHVLPLGVETKTFHPVDALAFRQRFGLGDSPYLVLTGRMHPTKGQIWAIRALSHLPSDIKLVLIGATDINAETNFQHNSYTAQLEAEIASLGLQERVIFTGALPPEDCAQAYSGALASLVPSVWLEAFGYITPDAMSCGTPVIITDNCGSADLVTDGVSGVIIPRENAQALAEAVLRIVPHREAMGQAARRTIEQYVVWDVIGPKTLAILAGGRT